MAFNHGSDAVFKVDDSGATLRDLSAYLTSAGVDRSNETADTTTLGSNSRNYIPGLFNGTIPIEGDFDPVADGYLEGILGVLRDFEYYPNGEPASATAPKYSGQAILTSYGVSTGVDDAAKMSGSFQISGDVTRATA